AFETAAERPTFNPEESLGKRRFSVVNRSRESAKGGGMRRRSKWPRVAAVLAGSALVVGIAAASTSATNGRADRPTAARTTTITLAHWSSSPVELKGVRATITAFEKRYPSIKVNEINLDPYPEGMLARLAARKPPDIFY